MKDIFLTVALCNQNFLAQSQQLSIFRMLSENNFQNATILFYEARYDNALRAINRYLEGKPRSSMGFNNRALIYFKMGQSSLAKEDFQTSIGLNHLNYVAYFNLFSLYVKQNDELSALFAIQGALSCLYLIKGRLLNDKQLLEKAIECSLNNIDAIILLVLLEVRDQKYGKALSLVEAAKSLKQHQGILEKMGVFIEELKKNYSEQREQALLDYLIDTSPVQLKLSGKPLKAQALAVKELKAKLDQKVVEFNKLYSEINIRAGGASYLIAKTPENQVQTEIGVVQSKEKDCRKKEEILARY